MSNKTTKKKCFLSSEDSPCYTTLNCCNDLYQIYCCIYHEPHFMSKRHICQKSTENMCKYYMRMEVSQVAPQENTSPRAMENLKKHVLDYSKTYNSLAI